MKVTIWFTSSTYSYITSINAGWMGLRPACPMVGTWHGADLAAIAYVPVGMV